jgi:hypothetical protein
VLDVSVDGPSVVPRSDKTLASLPSTKLRPHAMTFTKPSGAQFKAKSGQTRVSQAEIEQLRDAVRAYLKEYDNPVPDGMYRRTLREHLRSLVNDSN